MDREKLQQNPLPRQAAGLTREQATTIMRMARELEDTGRLCTLLGGSCRTDQEAGDWRRANRSVQCALQDYLDSLVEG